MSALPHYAETVARLDRKRGQVLRELHPELRTRVLLLLGDLGGRFTPYCGYRGPAEQAEAFAAGTSLARWGQSPHNWRPALAVDVVLNPLKVQVPEVKDPKFPGFPALWTDETEETASAWHALELAAVEHGLERVDLKNQKTGALERDRPHLQLHGWRSLIVI